MPNSNYKTGAHYGYIYDAGIIYNQNHGHIVVAMNDERETLEITAPTVFIDLANKL